MAGSRGTGPGKAMAVYSAARFGLFLLCLLVFYEAGLPILLALILAALVSGIAGYFLLARQRLALGAAIEGKVEQVRHNAAERTAREDAIADELAARQQEPPRPR